MTSPARASGFRRWPGRGQGDVEERLLADRRIRVVEDGVAVPELEPLTDLRHLHVRVEATGPVVEDERQVALRLLAALDALDRDDRVAEPAAGTDDQAIVGDAGAADVLVLPDLRAEGASGRGRPASPCRSAFRSDRPTPPRPPGKRPAQRLRTLVMACICQRCAIGGLRRPVREIPNAATCMAPFLRSRGMRGIPGAAHGDGSPGSVGSSGGVRSWIRAAGARPCHQLPSMG